MFAPILQQFGLSKNEAIIYEVLLKQGELAVGKIAEKSEIHRRNVYDSLKRLIEKGVVFEVLSAKENTYQAVDPQKFMEFVDEKKQILSRAMPHLQSLYQETPHQNEVMLYKGIQGWKNYFRDILRVGEDFYCISGKGGWMDPRISDYLPQFLKEAERQNITLWHIFDPEVKTKCPEIIEKVGPNYRFLPDQFITQASADVFGDYVCLPTLQAGAITEDFQMTVIRNPQTADAFRIWFQFMWENCEEA